jgi:hypothetical protein
MISRDRGRDCTACSLTDALYEGIQLVGENVVTQPGWNFPLSDRCGGLSFVKSSRQRTLLKARNLIGDSIQAD